MIRIRWFCVLLVPAWAWGARAVATDLPEVVEFNRHVRPIMSNTCFRCHGPDVKNNQSDLRLDVRELAVAARRDKSGRVTTAIVPGKPEQSEVWRRITSADPTLMMPPRDSLHQLSARDRALLRRWIEQGAPYEPHWAYRPPVKTPPPGASGTAHPIDAFIYQELVARGISPSPEADRRTLLRRVSLDLTGLPPTPEETAAFLADTAPGAYERVVDRLLASPHYGERMAVPWLDLVRFADTVGYHGDQQQNIFPYRDYVIEAFNRNQPFDQFTREQLAGDLLPQPTPAQLVASGFNRLNMMTREGGAQPQEYLAKYAADRVRTVSSVWLGSTLACAECHDHKYDPFSIRDFYRFAAYFADIKQWGVYSNYTYTPEPELAGFNNEYPFPPEIVIESPYLRERHERLSGRRRARVATAAQALLADPARTAAMLSWAAEVAPRLQATPLGWAAAGPENAPLADDAEALPDASVRFAPKAPRSAKLTLQPPVGAVAAVRLEVLPDEQHGGRVTRGLTRGSQDLFTVSLTLAVQRAGEEKPQPIALADAYAEQATETFSNARRLVSVHPRWRSARELVGQPQAAVYLLAAPLRLAEGDRLIATLTSIDVGRVRLAVSPLGGRLPGEPLSPATRAAFAATKPTGEQSELLAAEYFKSTGGGDAESLAASLAELRAIAECREGRADTMVTVATEPRETRVLPRGDWQDQSGELVAPGPPHFLPGGEQADPETRRTRLDLANWLVSPENPLIARTFVNRLWKQFFGTGLSAVLDDLGAQGEWPSHPELLDYLAVEFMERGWDVKAMVRLMVTSASYRQSARIRPELQPIDPHNRLLARQSPRRLEAEFVRDQALYAASLLQLDIGGPSVFPYQPEDYYAQLNFPLRDYVADTDERQWRRGVYMHWQRTFLHPMLANFDAPAREECTAVRTVSSTPQQALTLLNDPTFVEAARTLAEQVATGSEHFPEQLAAAFARVLTRAPSERERTSLEAFYLAQLAHYREQPDEARRLLSIGQRPPPTSAREAELAAWTSVARVLLNLNETIVTY